MLDHFHYAHHANLISCSLVLGNHMPPYSMFQQWGYGRCIKCYGSQVFTFYVSIFRESYFQPKLGNISVFFLLLQYKEKKLTKFKVTFCVCFFRKKKYIYIYSERILSTYRTTHSTSRELSNSKHLN